MNIVTKISQFFCFHKLSKCDSWGHTYYKLKEICTDLGHKMFYKKCEKFDKEIFLNKTTQK